MPRKPSAVLQYKLRIREALRRRIEQAAKKRGVSANYEMTSRLERSFDQDAVRSVDIVAADIEQHWARFGQAFYGLMLQGDLIRAAEALAKQVERLPDDAGKSPTISKAIVAVRQAISLIEKEAAKLPGKMHTTGVDQ